MNKIPRWLIALISALLINYALFAALGKLIGTSHYDNPLNHQPAISINFMPIHKGDSKRTHSVPIQPSRPAQRPENNAYKEQTHNAVPENKKRETEKLPEPKPLSIAKHTPKNRENHLPVGLQPTFRVEPIYPMFAITRGIEGWVTIKFAITENGEVAEPEVTASEPPDIFEQTALTAISRWRYPTGNKGKSSIHIKFELRNN